MEDKHWTQDEELVERFILNTLNPEERNELEDHLHICELCKQEVRAQQMLIAGIRRGGREALKERLREQVELLPEKTISWPHILSAAAVILILLSVGIYNRWFETMKQPENTIVLVHPDAAPASVSQDSTADVSPSEPAVDEKTIAMKDRLSPISKKKNEPRGRTDSGISGLADNDKPASMQSGSAAQGAGNITSRADAAKEVQSDILVAEPEIMWAEGTILPAGTEMRKTEQMNEQSAPNVVQRFGKADPIKARGEQKQAAGQLSLQVIQQNTSSIPLSQQQPRDQNKVLAKIERFDGQIQITVFLDSLTDERDLSQTMIEESGRDSVIVNIANQRLRYKIPPEWKRQLLAKPAR